MSKKFRDKYIDEQMLEFDKANTFKCKCGHSVVIYPKQTKRLCTWCNHYVYRDKKEEFKEKLKNSLKKANNML